MQENGNKKTAGTIPAAIMRLFLCPIRNKEEPHAVSF